MGKHELRDEINDPSRATDPEPDGQSYPEVSGAGVPFSNEPEDYDGHVDYVSGRAPGLDGRTYYDGHVEDEYPEVSGAGVPFFGTIEGKLIDKATPAQRDMYRTQLELYRRGVDKLIRPSPLLPKIEKGEFPCPTCTFSAFQERSDYGGVLIYHRSRYWPCRAPEGYVRQTLENGDLVDG